MSTTIKDIARAAGVSHTTVSRALRGHAAISTETTNRIRRLAETMGYVPNIIAQNLLAQRTQTIGIVVTTIADPFTTKIVEGVESVAQANEYSVFLSLSHNNPAQELAVVETFRRRRVDAIIVTSSRIGRLYGTLLDEMEIPIVLINNQEEGRYLFSVAVDDVQGAQLAVEHLLALGHQRIGYIGAPNRPRSNRRRLTGYQQACYNAGLSFDPALVPEATAEDDFTRGQTALADFLAAEATAVFCYNDMTAIGLLTACHQAGVAVPDSLSIVGFDDIEPTQYTLPALTTIRQPRGTLGQLAMSMVLDLLDGRETENRELACDLVVRESTARRR